MRSELQQERKECKLLERKNARLQEKIELTNKNRFASKSQKSKKQPISELEVQARADRSKENSHMTDRSRK